MNLKEIKNIFENNKYFSDISIEDKFEISGITNIWNKNDIEVSIEFNPDYCENLDFYSPSLKLIEEKLN
ncbi:hypothetical protein PSR68_01460 [Fusobacterium nucleatum]|nr:hypothetical protein [Fusobacterium nucleatum]WDD89304.1 hypothetical protein PSR68_01460 [Fusobacterium nucleatum]